MTDGLQRTTAAEFDRLRPYLLGVAHGHLGSISEAEDIVQDAWLRLAGARREAIRDLHAWLTTVVSRLSIDRLTSARARREEYVGPWLPESVVGPDAVDGDPARRTERDESVSLALLVVLESLSPAERGAFLLHDVFGDPFTEVPISWAARPPPFASSLHALGRQPRPGLRAIPLAPTSNHKSSMHSWRPRRTAISPP